MTTSTKLCLETVSAIHITPFDPHTKEIRWDLLEENVEFLIQSGAKVIVTSGNTGEFYSLTLEEVQQVVERVVRIVAGRASVVAGVGYAVQTAIQLGCQAAELGADAIMIHQPIHPYVTNQGALDYHQRIMQSVGIPAIVYFKDPNVSDWVLEQLAPLENLVAVKYAINDLPRFARLVRSVPRASGVTWVCGTAEKWAPFFFSAGATGFTSGLVNVAPKMSFQMLRALQTGDMATAWRVWEDVLPFEQLRAKYNNGNNVVVVKEAMSLVGMNGGTVREPVAPLQAEDREVLKALLKAWQI